MNGPTQQRAHNAARAHWAHVTCDGVALPVMPQHDLPIEGHTQVEFQGVCPEAEGLGEALEGVLARPVRGPTVPDDQEIASRRLQPC